MAPYSDRSKFVQVGKVIGVHGLDGRFKVEVHTEFPGRFDVGNTLYLVDTPRKVLTSFFTPRGKVVLKFEGINHRDEAIRFLGTPINIYSTEVKPAEKGDYYHYEILGLQAYTADREYLGEITEIVATGNNDVYVVTKDSIELLLPATTDVIKEINIDLGTMCVDIPEGLRPTA